MEEILINKINILVSLLYEIYYTIHISVFQTRYLFNGYIKFELIISDDDIAKLKNK